MVNGAMVSPCVKRKPSGRTSCFGGAAMNVFCARSGMERGRISLLPLALQLPLVNPPYLIDGRDLVDRLVVADARDAREAQGVARLVSLRLLDSIERDLQDHRRLHDVHRPVARDGGRLE